MSDNKGTLKLRVKVGESVFIGDSEVVLSTISGNSAELVFVADKSVKIFRKSVLNLAPKKSEIKH